jgi:hypothetical protein
MPREVMKIPTTMLMAQTPVLVRNNRLLTNWTTLTQKRRKKVEGRK